MKWWPLRFSIRVQLFAVSLFLFAIPWLGYKYVWELEQYLRLGQEQAMIGTARAVATALHERSALFDSRSSYLQSVRPGTDLYAPTIPTPIRLDGELRDWQSIDELARTYSAEQVVTWFDRNLSEADVSLSFRHMVGRYGPYFYAMFAVTDDHLIWRDPNSLSVDQSDHLLIGLLDNDNQLHRYIISPYASGWVNAYTMTPQQGTYRAADNELRIQGRWMQTPQGYAIELRFPLTMTSGALAFAIVDVDDATARHKKYAVGTANPDNTDALGTVVTPSPEIERILAGLEYADSRVWVVDKHKRVLARAGDIQAAPGLNVRAQTQSEWAWWNWLEKNLLLPMYYYILTRPPAEFVDEMADAYALAGQDISNALNGKADSLWRLTPDNKAVILSAAHPIFIDEQVMGAVVVEQTTNGIRTLRNRALEQLFHVILAVLILTTLAMVVFANRISNRIRKLRDETEAVIDENGKIVGAITPLRQRDEIGDLSRAFASVLGRLQQYNSYLENMASRLSHELRTPVAVVRSSLDSLNQSNDTDEQTQFVERAQSGIHRLSTILNSLSEATRLEQAIAQEEREYYDLAHLLQSYVSGCQQVYAERKFKLDCQMDSCRVSGSGDLFAQLLDKVIANAIEFSQPNDTITLRLQQQDKHARVTITNPGPLLPDGMRDELFQSMVSMRGDEGRQSMTSHPHLGLGLYIANMIINFHKGTITLANLPDHSGVSVDLILPIATPSQ